MQKAVYILHAEIIKALAHPLRLEVTELLSGGEKCFSEILDKTGGLKSNLSQHLSIMADNGLLRVRKDSRCNYYSLASPKVAKACEMLKEVLSNNIKKQTKILSSV